MVKCLMKLKYNLHFSCFCFVLTSNNPCELNKNKKQVIKGKSISYISEQKLVQNIVSVYNFKNKNLSMRKLHNDAKFSFIFCTCITFIPSHIKLIYLCPDLTKV